jgi:uncharacterized membrane protein YqiK
MVWTLTEILILAGVILVSLVTIGLILARLYKRASKEISFVRTGFGGQVVVMNGGALVLPVLHETIPVNMNTLRLEVQRANTAALITKDRMRVDVQAEFYVRVQPTREAIADAAQTLGQRTMYPDALKELVEGKFVDALRAVAAEMSMEELHEQRVEFVQKVQQAVSEDLLKNGLELESVSLTGLDQTDREFFNPDNAFDAAGLTRLTMEIEERRKKRNDIEQDTAVEIERKNLEARQRSLEIMRDKEYAELEQQREVEIRRAAQTAEIAREQAARKQEAEQAQISADQAVNLSRIESERAVDEQRISKEQAIREREIGRERAIEAAEIERRKLVELSDQDRQIAVSEKSRSESEARAVADKARAEAVRASEQVETVRETETAERAKAVDLVEARRAAEREAIQVTVRAEAERSAAEDEAEAIRTLASARKEEQVIQAEGEAAAIRLRAEADELRLKVEAAGRQALNEADNLLSQEVVAMKIKLAVIEHLQGIVRESVKPMEQIDGIKIIHVEGLNGGAGGAAAAGETSAGGGGNLADQVVSSALRYRGQAPLIDALLKDVGIDASSLNGFTNGIVPTPKADD